LQLSIAERASSSHLHQNLNEKINKMHFNSQNL